MSDFDTKKVEEARGFVSSLGTGREAFHSEVTEFCLRIGERSAEDFIRHFPPSKIMEVLASRPMERARIVTEASGIREKVALNKYGVARVVVTGLKQGVHPARVGYTGGPTVWKSVRKAAIRMPAPKR